MMSSLLVGTVSLLYIALLFMVAYYADRKQEQGKSLIANSYVYSLSIAVYATSWTFYGSVGKAATTGLDFILIYLGPSLTAFSWWFLLRKIVRIAKQNKITSIADFISSRYGKSQVLGALVTVIAILGIMPYIALQLKAVSTTFDIICSYQSNSHHLGMSGSNSSTMHTGFISAFILSIFSVIFGARNLVSSERHEGLVAAIAVESIVKLVSFMAVGIYVTYFLFEGAGDILGRISNDQGLLKKLMTFGENGPITYINWFVMLFLSMGAIMLLPRQFHILVIENSDEDHIKGAMWRFPIYLYLINIFVVPIAFGGILLTGGNSGADYFVLTIPLMSGHSWLALIAFLGGFSAAAGMVIVESVAISTMFLNHLVMPIIVRLRPRSWFSVLLINIKRFGIFLVVFLGFLYYQIVGETYMLVNLGLISFAAAAQFGPALIGGIYWRRGNKIGALTGIFFGFLLWFYTLLLPSVIQSGWLSSDIVSEGLFGWQLLKPTALFGLSGFDIWSHSLFWSMFFNIASYLACSILFKQSDKEIEQAVRFVDVFAPPAEEIKRETKRLSKPITIMQFVNLMSKFIGEPQAHSAISSYIGDREIDEKGGVSEFDLPDLKRFTEKTLAASVGAAAAGAIVESYLSDIGSKMEPVYDIYSKVRADLNESSENLFVRLKASEIMAGTKDLQAIMDDLLDLLLKEFKFDLAIIRLQNEHGLLVRRSFRGLQIRSIIERTIVPEISTYAGDAFLSNKPYFVNDTRHVTKTETKELVQIEEIQSFAHIPIAREGEPPLGVLSVFSRTIVGLFTQPFIALLSSLAGQLAQAVTIDSEMKAKEMERLEKEKALLENARVARDMEIAQQIQLSLLPAAPPALAGVSFACRCIPAAHVGGDYYDFFIRDNSWIDIVIADVSGHSVGSALIMAEARSVLRAEIQSVAGAGKMLSLLNRLLFDDLNRADLFITMFYAKFDLQSRVMTYANAGHTPTIVIPGGTIPSCELDAEGMILGIREEMDFEEKSLRLNPGDLVLFYTDGIIEAGNAEGTLFGVEKLISILISCRHETAEYICDSILRAVMVHAGDTPLEDDISMIVMKVA